MVAASNTANGQPTLDSFLAQATFSVDLCNTVLVMWILLHALPFNRFYDSPLRAAFKLANRRAELRTPTWAAGVAKELYFSLSSAAVSMVQVSTIIFPKFHVIQFFFSLNFFTGKPWKVFFGSRRLDHKGQPVCIYRGVCKPHR